MQHDSWVRCAACDLTITKEVLGLAKFARDLVIDPQDQGDVKAYGNGVYMACVHQQYGKGLTRADLLGMNLAVHIIRR